MDIFSIFLGFCIVIVPFVVCKLTKLSEITAVLNDYVLSTHKVTLIDRHLLIAWPYGRNNTCGRDLTLVTMSPFFINYF